MSHEGQRNELASTDLRALRAELIQTHLAGNLWKGLFNAALFVAPFWVIIAWLLS